MGLLPLLPWFVLLISRLSSVQKAAHWLNEDQTVKELMVQWAENISRIFSSPFSSPDPRLFLFTVFLGVLFAWSIIRMILQNQLRGGLVAVLLCIVPFGIFMVSDLLLGGQKSTVFRYLLPSYIGSLLIFGFGLSFNDPDSSKQNKNYGWFGGTIFYAVLIVAIYSSWFNLHSSSWWGTESSSELSAAQTIIETSDRAIVVSDQPFGDFIYFALLLRPTDYILWLKPYHDINEKYIFSNFESIFLWNPSETLLDKAESIEDRKKAIIEPLGSTGVLQIKQR